MPAEGSSVQSQFLVIASSRLVSSAVQAAVGIGLARSVRPDEYGLVVAVAGAVLLWFIVCDLGVSSHLGRIRAVGSREDVESALFLNVLCAVVGAVVALVVTVSFSVGEGWQLALALALIVVAQALDKNIDAALAVPIADGERSLPAASAVLRRVVTAVVFFALLLTGFDPVVGYGIAVAAGPLAGQVQMRWWLRSAGLRSRPGPDVARIARGSLPFALNDIAVQSRNLDVSVVALATNAGTAGIYAAASKLTSPFQLVTSTLAGVILPRASRAGRARVRSAAVVMMLAAVGLLLPVGAVAWFAEPVIVFVVGADYAAAAPALVFMLLALPFVGVTAPLASLLQGSGRERFVAVHSAVFAVLILVGIGVGALFGATGAAAGFAVASLLKAVTLFLVIVGQPAEPPVAVAQR